MAIVNVIVIHGVGELRKKGMTYSEPLQQKIRRHFGPAPADALAFHEVNWSDIGDAEENDLILNKRVLPDATLPGAGALWPPNHFVGEALDGLLNASEQARRFVLLGIGDVLIYLTKKGGEAIRQRLIDTILHVRQEAMAAYPDREQHYVSIIAHSLGSVVTYDTCALLATELREQVAGLGLANLFTMGSPLALFSLLQYGGRQLHYAQRGVYLDRPDGEWINFYDQQDPIAFPLRYVYPPLQVPGRNYTIQDQRVQTGTFHAHTNYFVNDRIAAEIAKRLRREYEHEGRLT
jgi:hypothetical protein